MFPPYIDAALCKIIFKGYSLPERLLQEKGVRPIRTFSLQKYALIFGLIWSLIFIRGRDISPIFNSPKLILLILAIAITWNVQQFISSYISNKTSTISAQTTFSQLLLLPQLLLIGWAINHDVPNAYSVLAIVILCVAITLQPSHHKTNTRKRFSLPLLLILLLLALQAFIDSINAGMSREVLKSVHANIFIGVFVSITMLIAWAWTAFTPNRSSDTKILKNNRVLTALIPSAWFVATIPETYAFAAIPIYTVFSIGTISFLIDTVADLVNHRVRLSVRTMAFIGLTLLGMGMAAYSI